MSDTSKKTKKKVAKKESLKSEIKEMEKKRREAAMKAADVKKDAKMSFDAWWMVRSPKIPRIHKKEIIRADFGARGLTSFEGMEDYDKALEKYGIKLK